MKDNKEHILKMAFHLFMRKSYKAVTLKDIIHATGLSNGTFYYYFENKEQLFKEVAEHYMFKLTRQTFENSPKDSLHNFIRHALDNFRHIFNTLHRNTEPDLNVNFFSFLFEALRYFPELQEELLKLQAQETNAWVEIIGIAKKNGEIRQDIPDDAVAKLFIYASDGNRMDYVLDKDIEALKSRMEILWNELYNILKV
ncbi:TetR family transcriptional regulator [Bacteroidia bacterium]|nr:TetR family transcriptional regulator [Bacteroidia bacterium]